MTTTPLDSPLRGIIPPIVTPLIDQDQIDVRGTERLLEHVIGGGVHGVFALGTTGEGTSLNGRTKNQYVEIVCDTVQQRVPVLVCITDTSLTSAIELAELSYGAGAAALVTAAPYYLPLTQRDLETYIEKLADCVPLPLMLYNMPSCTKTAFNLDTVRALSQHENIIGLKDTSGDLDYFAKAAKIASQRDDFTLLIGPEEKLLSSLQLGGMGGVTGGANMFPTLYVALYEAATTGQADRAEELNEVIQRVSKRFYRISDSGAKVIQGIKAGLSELGICSGIVAQPFRTYSEQERALISAAVGEIETLLEQVAAFGV